MPWPVLKCQRGRPVEASSPSSEPASSQEKQSTSRCKNPATGIALADLWITPHLLGIRNRRTEGGQQDFAPLWRQRGHNQADLLPFKSDLNSTWRLDSEGSQEVVLMYSTIRILGNLHVVEA